MKTEILYICALSFKGAKGLNIHENFEHGQPQVGITDALCMLHLSICRILWMPHFLLSISTLVQVYLPHDWQIERKSYLYLWHVLKAFKNKHQYNFTLTKQVILLWPSRSWAMAILNQTRQVIGSWDRLWPTWKFWCHTVSQILLTIVPLQWSSLRTSLGKMAMLLQFHPEGKVVLPQGLQNDTQSSGLSSISNLQNLTNLVCS